MSRDLVERAAELITYRYVFPDLAAELAERLGARSAAGDFDGLDEERLGAELTGQLLAWSGDTHLRVRLREQSSTGKSGETDPEAAWREYQRQTGYGIARVERLDGNVGHIDIRSVADPSIGGHAITAAMELIASTGALILDLRRNKGGAPDGVIFWCSHFFPDSRTHLNNIYQRESGATRQYWSLAYLPGKRYLDRPVYVLTSNETFSAGEEFCYNLQAQGRATVIGESTRGGAHPTDSFPLTDTLEITIPIARSINPVTGTNWEGTGVHPDIEVQADRAFTAAYDKALSDVLEESPPELIAEEARTARDSLT